MDRSAVIKLITISYSVDSIGQRVPTEESVSRFCQLSSVSQSEWFEAGRNGLKAEYRAVLYADEYHGEQIAEINGIHYGVYRTYRTKSDTIELYLERKAGVFAEPEETPTPTPTPDPIPLPIS